MASTVPNDDYVLSRDYIDVSRLNLQHRLWTQMFGYLLHPDIDTSKPDLKIADVGTGTGAWLSDLAPHLPSTAQLDGYDLDISQAPPAEWLPSNMRLRTWDAFSSVPDDMVGQYDIVHAKLFVFVVKGDPTVLLRNMLRLLKPGGYLQWAEVDVPGMKLTKTNPSLPSEHMNQLFSMTASQDPRLVPAWPDQLPDIFAREGLQKITAHRVSAAPHLEYAMHHCNLMMYDMIAQRAGNGAKAKEIMDLVPKAAAESRRGAVFAFPRITVVGRREEKAEL
ncbi:S-adenosyl-L-methionine-dependent methyltransferase [Aspergillus steynii IBT 23096]|uniref:S-adenosyl-L-methionine-dependent methyltransferase n=1 Tax=Aspergillus steynii IBT 23096 TaxID=1392250 RepID=A0A2I2GD09_9EURO|nr:S-adenosyl-L-methionine-dependent methyltransferase [Aspergillus steynii IBT 23096]PLB50769.1 S-adenosyl-L-methionine-dependent methyltransferase [Aspergillus steynii IBT 23096]